MINDLGFGNKKESLLESIVSQAKAIGVRIERRTKEDKKLRYTPLRTYSHVKYEIIICENGTVTSKELDEVMGVYETNLKPEGDELARKRKDYRDYLTYLILVKHASKTIGFLASSVEVCEIYKIHTFKGAAINNSYQRENFA